jgi:hypothetical protein
LPEISGPYKIAANAHNFCMSLFSCFHVIYSGCCTVAARVLGTMPE